MSCIFISQLVAYDVDNQSGRIGWHANDAFADDSCKIANCANNYVVDDGENE